MGPRLMAAAAGTVAFLVAANTQNKPDTNQLPETMSTSCSNGLFTLPAEGMDPTSCMDPDPRCFHMPDWKQFCELPEAGLCTTEPRYLSGYYFDHHTCSCRMGRYINTECNIAQEKPVFNSISACEAVCRPGCQLVNGQCGCYKIGHVGHLIHNPFEDQLGWPGKPSCEDVRHR